MNWNFLEKFANILPGDTYTKKLFYWNLIQYIAAWVMALFLLPLRDAGVGGVLGWYVFLVFNELLTNDGHIYGDLAYIITGLEIRAFVWIFSMLAVVILSYLWGFKNSKKAKYIRTATWAFTLLFYLVWTIFFPMRPDYDYAVWANYIVLYEYNPLVIFLAGFSIFIMWFGVIISSGYLIYKGWKEG